MASVFSPIREMHPDEYRRVTEVTYLGSVHGTLAALRWTRPRNRGSIVQVRVGARLLEIPLQSAYCAAKHAVQGFMDSRRTELIYEGSAVTISSVLHERASVRLGLSPCASSCSLSAYFGRTAAPMFAAMPRSPVREAQRTIEARICLTDHSGDTRQRPLFRQRMQLQTRIRVAPGGACAAAGCRPAACTIHRQRLQAPHVPPPMEIL
jgi:NAD(P)-dependent dehydrogenase (short-subunit alcohol dehydrogenase family)